jgi:REP-associated tyrosine transposase
MTYDPERHHRRSVRLKEYDYASNGAYFVTLCTAGRVENLAKIADGQVQLSSLGDIADQCWKAIPQHFPSVELDAYVIMPNHMHSIFVIASDNDVGARHASPSQPSGVDPRSAGAIVGSFKSAATRLVNKMRKTPGAALWQRNYYERVIRNEGELRALREYIANNPLKWEMDEDNPANY